MMQAKVFHAKDNSSESVMTEVIMKVFEKTRVETKVAVFLLTACLLVGQSLSLSCQAQPQEALRQYQLAQGTLPWNTGSASTDSSSPSENSSDGKRSPGANAKSTSGNAHPDPSAQEQDAQASSTAVANNGGDEKSVNESIDKARSLVSAGNLVEARQLLKQLIRSNPKEVRLLLEYYPVCVKSNDWSDSVQTLEKLFVLDPAKEKDLYAGYGEALYKLRRLDKAQVAFNKALDFGKDKELIHRTLIEIAKQQKNDLMAESEFAEYLKLKPNDGDMQFEYANTLYKLKRNKEAVARYKLAAQLKPTDSYVQEKLGFVLLSERDYAGSIAAYRKAIQADPKSSARLGAALKYARAQQKAAGQAAEPAK